MLARLTVVLGAVGFIPYAVIVGFEARQIDEGGSAVALIVGGLLAAAVAAIAVGWRWGEAGIDGVAVTSWVLVGGWIVGALSALAVDHDPWNLSTYLAVSFIGFFWIIIPTLCAPAFLAWAGSWANPQRRRQRAAMRDLQRSWARAQSVNWFDHVDRPAVRDDPP